MVPFTFSRMVTLVGRLAWRQLKTEKYFALAMIANMTFGLLGYIVVDGFNRAFLNEVKSRTRVIAAGDLVVSSRQPWTSRQLEILDESISKSAPKSEEISLVSMVSFGEKSRLVDLRFVSPEFPLYAGLQLADEGILPGGSAKRLGHDGAWIHRELQVQLALNLHDRIKIGSVEVSVVGIISDDPTSGVGSFSFAPRVYLPIGLAEASKLVEFGSRVLFLNRYIIDDNEKLDGIVSNLKRTFGLEFPTLDLRAQTHFQSSRETSRIYTYLHDYLALISLVSLFLAAIGYAYLMRSHLDASLAEVAIMSTLGASRGIAFAVYICQGIMLGLLAIILSVSLALGLIPLIAKILTPISGSLPSIDPPIISGVLGGCFCLVGGSLLSIPQLIKLWSMNTSFLLGGGNQFNIQRSVSAWFGILPAFALLWMVAVLESRSFTNGSVFSFGFVISSIILSLIAIPLSSLGLRLSRQTWLGWRSSLALKMISRNRTATVSTFVALAIGATLINIVPQLQNVITREVARPDSQLPQLFMFDIQDDQVEFVKNSLTNKNISISSLQPMIRARLESINDQPVNDRKMDFEGEREEQQRQALQSRTQNLSFRGQLSASEQLVSGNFIGENFDGQGDPAISIEEGFAKRVGVKLGDKMTFDVMGVVIKGVVRSVRRVRWTSFEPNFMILLQPGVLESAPKTWVGSVGRIPEGQVDSVIGDIVAQHSNITVVDIKSAVGRILSLVEKISGAIMIVSWLALVGGAGVLFAIAYARSSAREYAIGLLKVLGATSAEALSSVIIEYTIISAVAIVFGLILSLGFSWSISLFIFKAPWVLDDVGGWLIGLLILPFCVFLAWVATRRAAYANVLRLLN